MDLNIIIALITFGIGVVCIYLESFIVKKFAGKLRTTIIYIMVGTLIFTIGQLIEILFVDFIPIDPMRIMEKLTGLVMLLCIFISVLIMNQTLKKIQ